MEKMLTTREAAEFLGIGRDRVVGLIKEGKINRAKKNDSGTRWLVPEPALEEFRATYVHVPRANLRRDWSLLYREIFAEEGETAESRGLSELMNVLTGIKDAVLKMRKDFEASHRKLEQELQRLHQTLATHERRTK